MESIIIISISFCCFALPVEVLLELALKKRNETVHSKQNNYFGVYFHHRVFRASFPGCYHSNSYKYANVEGENLGIWLWTDTSGRQRVDTWEGQCLTVIITSLR